MQTVEVSYSPDCFNVEDVQHAKNVILGAVGDDPIEQMEERWKTETPWLTSEIAYKLCLNPEMTVVDYGCGIGRLAKGLIESTGCKIVGVDISSSMRALALEYVDSPNFSTISPLVWRTMVLDGTRFDSAYSVWVLQHCAYPGQIADTLKISLVDGGLFYVVDENDRFVPTNAGWVDDRISVEESLNKRFSLVEKGKLPVGVTSKKLSDRTATYLYSKAKK
ncbi:MAG: class I SAM-dependent methyltransferase [Candidatus Micrarchaeota archaeon]|nr:class I SAM-dependent methyltransferase [Candidatus Micrarchaeota archaeon]